MSDKGEIHHTDAVDGPRTKASKRRKCGAHCKRFWWAYLIAFLCIVVLVTCLVIFVAVPNIAQDAVNDARLEIQGVHILESEPDEYLMEVNSTIRTSGGLHATVAPFTGDLYLEDVEGHPVFATLDFPETNGDSYQEVNVSQRVHITDLEAFETFNIWFFNNETLRLTIDGRTSVRPRGLSRDYGVTFRKTIDVTGLNLLRGSELNSETAELTLETDDEGHNFWGEVEIPNASHFTLDIGDVAFTNYVDEEDGNSTEVGILYIENLMLYPGINRYNVSATMEQARIIELLRSDEFCETGIIPFKLLGQNTTNSDGEVLEYFLAGLASANQTIDIDIATIIQNNLNLTIGCEEESED